MKNLLKNAENAAHEAGKILKTNGDKRVSLCSKNDVKLRADVDSERIIRERLEETKLQIIGEELGGNPQLYNAAGTLYWVVDPLDGTFNFLRNQPQTCTSIGLMNGSEPVLGVIYNFNSNELISGIAGEEIKINGKKIVPEWANEIDQACLMTGFPALADKSPEALKPFFETIGKFKKIRMIGSAALAISYVATGKAEVYHEENTNLWDVAAGLALIKAAGAFFKITPTKKHALNFNLRCAAKQEWL